MASEHEVVNAERLARLEVNYIDMHGDIHDVREEMIKLKDGILGLTLEAGRRPSWMVTSYITLVTALLAAFVGAALAGRF